MTPSTAGERVAETAGRARSGVAWTLSTPDLGQVARRRRRGRRCRSRSAFRSRTCRERSRAGSRARTGCRCRRGSAARPRRPGRDRGGRCPDGPSRPLWPGIATAEAPSAASVERKVPGALGRVDDERHAGRLGALDHRLERQQHAGDVRRVRRDRQARRRAAERAHVHSSRSISPVFPSAAHDLEGAAAAAAPGRAAAASPSCARATSSRSRAPSAREPEDGEVERLGRVLGEDQLVRRLRAEQVGEALARQADGARRGDRAAVARAARCCRPAFAKKSWIASSTTRRLGPRGGRVVEVDVRSLISAHDPIVRRRSSSCRRPPAR